MVKAPAGGSCFPLLVKILLLTVFLVNSDHFCIWILVQLHFGRLPQLMSSLEHQNFPEKPEILVVWEQNSRRNTFSRLRWPAGGSCLYWHKLMGIYCSSTALIMAKMCILNVKRSRHGCVNCVTEPFHPFWYRVNLASVEQSPFGNNLWPYWWNRVILSQMEQGGFSVCWKVPF